MQRRMVVLWTRQHFVSRKFQKHGPLVTQAGIKTAIDFPECREVIFECCRRDRDFFKDFALCIEVFDTMMQQRISEPFVHPG